MMEKLLQDIEEITLPNYKRQLIKLVDKNKLLQIEIDYIEYNKKIQIKQLELTLSETICVDKICNEKCDLLYKNQLHLQKKMEEQQIKLLQIVQFHELKGIKMKMNEMHKTIVEISTKINNNNNRFILKKNCF